MAETSRFWDGSTTGDATAAPYDAPTEFAAVLNSLSGAAGIPTNLGGVCSNELNELVVTAPGSVSPCSVASGRAINYGSWYENTTAVSVAIPTPGASTRVDRIVLRKDWVLQTIRITRIAGTEGAGVPALTQVAGTTWDEPLSQASITTGGVITLTDDREFHPFVPVAFCINTTPSIAVGTSGKFTMNGTPAAGQSFAQYITHDVANNRMTALYPGLYAFGYVAKGLGVAGPTGALFFTVNKNGGAAYSFGGNGYLSATCGVTTGVCLINLSVGDYVEVFYDASGLSVGGPYSIEGKFFIALLSRRQVQAG